jgi:hypothetical protein
MKPSVVESETPVEVFSADPAESVFTADPVEEAAKETLK